MDRLICWSSTDSTRRPANSACLAFRVESSIAAPLTTKENVEPLPASLSA